MNWECSVLPLDLNANAFEPNATMASAISNLAAGDPVIVTGSPDGPFVMCAAENVTPAHINLMAAHARGLVGLVLTKRRAADLGLELQPRQGRENAPLYTMSIEATEGTTTGISATDRTTTIRAAALGRAGDVITPGHIFPQVTNGRPTGQAELALRLLCAAEASPVAAICTVLDESGMVATASDARALAADLGLVSVDLCDMQAPAGPEFFS